MEPFSASVNVLTVLMAASKSSFALYKFFRSIHDAPVEIQYHCNLLRGLSYIFSTLKELQCEGHNCLEISDGFILRVADCLTDLGAVYARFEESERGIKHSQIRGTWEKLKWAVNSESRLDKFFHRLQIYHTEFGLELDIIQIKIQTSIHTLLLRGITPPKDKMKRKYPVGLKVSSIGTSCLEPFSVPISSPEANPSGTNYTDNEDLGSPWLQASGQEGRNWATLVAQWHLAQYDQVARTMLTGIDYTRCYQGLGSTTVLQIGSTYRRTWMPCHIKEPRRLGLVLKGRSLSLCLYLKTLSSRQLAIKFHISVDICGGAPLALSTRYNLQLPRIVPADAAIVECVRRGDVFSMEALFRCGKASPSDMLACRTTLLHIAALHHHIATIKFLISYGADVDALDRDGDTPLHIVCAKGKLYEGARALLGSGCDPSSRNFAGRSCYHVSPNAVIRHMLLVHDGPIDLFAQDCDGMTVLHHLCWSKTTSAAEVLRLIENSPSSLFVRDNQERIPLHFAVMRGNVGVASCLLDHHRQQQELLHHSHHQQHEILKPQSNHAFSPALTCPNGKTLIHFAAQSPRPEIIDLLLTPDNVANPRSACSNAQGEERESQNLLLRLSLKDHQGHTLLHYAAWYDNVAAVDKVLELVGYRSGENREGSGRNLDSANTTVAAATAADTVAAELLYARNFDGKTPLDLARHVSAENVLRIFDGFTAEAAEAATATVTKTYSGYRQSSFDSVRSPRGEAQSQGEMVRKEQYARSAAATEAGSIMQAKRPFTACNAQPTKRRLKAEIHIEEKARVGRPAVVLLLVSMLVTWLMLWTRGAHPLA